MLVFSFILFILVSLFWKSIFGTMIRDPRVDSLDLWLGASIILGAVLFFGGLWTVIVTKTGLAICGPMFVATLNETYHAVDDARYIRA